MADLEADGYIKCTVKKAISLRVGNPSVEFKSGCSVIDVMFPDGQPVEVIIYIVYEKERVLQGRAISLTISHLLL